MKNKESDDLNLVLKSVVKKNKANAGRIDDIIISTAKLDTNQYISQEILKWIDKSKMVIADLSEKNPNVYFELGYAIAKGKKVLPLAKEGTKLPFDVKDINTIFYKDMAKDLPTKLNNILSTILAKKP